MSNGNADVVFEGVTEGVIEGVFEGVKVGVGVGVVVAGNPTQGIPQLNCSVLFKR